MNLHRQAAAARAARASRCASASSAPASSARCSWRRRRARRGCISSAIADLAPDRARAALRRVGWPAERIAARSLRRGARARHDLHRRRRRRADRAPTDRGRRSTPPAIRPPASRHALLCCDARQAHRHGQRRGRRARRAAAGAHAPPRPASSIAGLRRPAGADLRAGRLGARRRLRRRRRRQGHEVPAATITPRRPRRCGATTASPPEQARLGGMNPQMFNSFLDGTKSAIEMAAVANATGLDAARPTGSASRPAASTICRACCGRRPTAACSHRKGQVEVVSSLERDGRPVFRDLRWGVYVTFEAPTATMSARCFAEYGLVTDPSGRYAAMYKPFHLIGLELGISVASAGAARRGDRRADRLPRRRRGDRQARSAQPARSSTARAASPSMAGSCRRPIRLPRRPADRPRARRHAAAAGEAGRCRPLAGRRDRRTGEAVRIRREMEGIFRQEWGFGGVYAGATAAY